MLKRLPHYHTNGENGEAYNIVAEDDGLTLGGYAKYMAKLAGRKVSYQIEDDESASRTSYALLDASRLKDL